MKRVFIAIEINNNDALVKLTESFKIRLKDEKIRWVKQVNMHLTLAFLGEKQEDQVRRAGEIMYNVAGNYNCFEIGFGGTGIFSDINHPRVIWLGLKAPDTLYDMQNMLCSKLIRDDLYKEKNPFSPHITLGRMKYINNRKLLADILQSSRHDKLTSQIVHELVLFESILKPEGPVYHPLKKAPLICH